MSLDFNDAKEAMPSNTYLLFEYLSEFHFDRWTLVGGTALSIHIKHRTSEDLDFFCEDKELSIGALNDLEKLFSTMRDNGIVINETSRDDKNRSYEINGVLLTFFASGLKTLKNNSISIGKINVASLNLIAAMKIEAIIKYRTVTRDFFDIYTLSLEYDKNLYALIDNFRNFYSTMTVDDSSFEREFFDKAPDADDKGYQNIEVNTVEKSIKEIRSYYEEYLQNIKLLEDESILNYVEENVLSDTRLYGTNRNSFVQKLSTLIEFKELIKLLNKATFELTYTSMDGKALLDNYLDELKELKIILSFYKEIPLNWIDSNRYKFREGVLDMLKYENSVISMASSNANDDRIKSTAKKKGFDEKEFVFDVERKRGGFEGSYS